jgi:hypothetical protein
LEGRILKLPLGKGNKLKERSWRLTKGEGSLLGWKRKKEKKECARKKKRRRLVLMCEKGVVHERDVCKN